MVKTITAAIVSAIIGWAVSLFWGLYSLGSICVCFWLYRLMENRINKYWDTAFRDEAIKYAKYMKITFIVPVFIAFLAIGFSIFDFWGLRDAKNKYESFHSGIKFRLPFYCAIPGDSDLILTGLEISRESGQGIQLTGLRNEVINLKISKQEKVGDTYYATFQMSGFVNVSVIREGPGAVIELKRHTFSGPIYAGHYQFYIFIDDVTQDSVFISMAKRRMKHLTIAMLNIPFGLKFLDEEGPASFIKNCGDFL